MFALTDDPVQIATLVQAVLTMQEKLSHLTTFPRLYKGNG